MAVESVVRLAETKNTAAEVLSAPDSFRALRLLASGKMRRAEPPAVELFEKNRMQDAKPYGRVQHPERRPTRAGCQDVAPI